jgi:hypothetical protein
MKSKNYFIPLLFSIALSSCSSVVFYQVYQVTPDEKIIVSNNKLIYEDDNCIVLYNLWAESGNMDFSFFNKTEHPIHLNLEESFFIVNGVANNYFKNRVYTFSESSGATASRGAVASRSVTGLNTFNQIQTHQLAASGSTGVVVSSGHSISYNEEKIISINKTGQDFSRPVCE